VTTQKKILCGKMQSIFNVKACGSVTNALRGGGGRDPMLNKYM
jgi:hypothetical protein